MMNRMQRRSSRSVAGNPGELFTVSPERVEPQPLGGTVLVCRRARQPSFWRGRVAPGSLIRRTRITSCVSLPNRLRYRMLL